MYFATFDKENVQTCGGGSVKDCVVGSGSCEFSCWVVLPCRVILGPLDKRNVQVYGSVICIGVNYRIFAVLCVMLGDVTALSEFPSRGAAVWGYPGITDRRPGIVGCT